MGQPWPGEKLDLWDAGVAAGSQSSFDLWSRLRVAEAVDTSVTLTAGDDIWVWSMWTRLLLDTDPIGTCNWILENVTGGGTVELYTGHDPGFSGDQPTDWALAGSLSDGRNVIPLPVEDRTFEALFGDVEGLALRLRVTSGTVTLSQIRLQVEPPGGLQIRTGWHWSDFQTPPVVSLASDFGTGAAGTGASISGVLDKNAPLDLMRSGAGNAAPGLAPGGTAPNSYTFGLGDGDVFTSGTIGAHSYDRVTELPTVPPVSDGGLDVGYASGIWKERPSYRTVPGFFFDGSLKVGRDYEKIDGGSTWPSYGEFGAGDTDALTWNPVGASVTKVSGDPAHGIGVNVGYTESLLLSPTSPAWSGTFSGWPPSLAGGATHLTDADSGTTVDFGVPTPGGDWTVTIHGDLSELGFYPAAGDYSIFQDWHDWAVAVSASIQYQLPDFRYHVPTFEPDPDAASIYPDPRFFVKHPYGMMTKHDPDGNPVLVDPVGFGIPEGTRIFRVPTATGLYRDLTKAEYQALAPGERPPGGLPLKVKRDGGRWDLVAWLVPD